ncbi:MAG: RbsD/FucU family protein [Limnohabitans sp.]
MLKGIDPVLSPELLMYLSAMGHGEWVAVVDANFTAEYLRNGKRLVRLPGLGLARVTQAVLSVFPLAEDVAQPAAYMQVSSSAPHHRTAAQQAVVDILDEAGIPAQNVAAVERFAFYEKMKTASLLVQTGEGTAYGNAMFCKGVILC